MMVCVRGRSDGMGACMWLYYVFVFSVCDAFTVCARVWFVCVRYLAALKFPEAPFFVLGLFF